jgi:hypothetical protein
MLEGDGVEAKLKRRQECLQLKPGKAPGSGVHGTGSRSSITKGVAKRFRNRKQRRDNKATV